MTDDEHDVSWDPDLDLALFPQDPQARLPHERLDAWLDRLCASR